MWSPASAMVQDRQRLRRLAGRGQQRADTALQRGDAVLHDRLGRVHDPGVDVAEFLQREQLAAVLGGIEGVRRGLVDRQRPGLGGGVGRLAGVDLAGLEGPVRGHHALLGEVDSGSSKGYGDWGEAGRSGISSVAAHSRAVRRDGSDSGAPTSRPDPGRPLGRRADVSRYNTSWSASRHSSSSSTGSGDRRTRACGSPGPVIRLVITRGTPPRVEGCRPASRGCAGTHDLRASVATPEPRQDH